MEIQSPAKRVLSEQPRALVGIACRFPLPITHHLYVDPVSTGETDVLLLTPPSPKILLYFIYESLIFFTFSVIQTFYNFIKPALQFRSYLKIKSKSKFSPREKAAHSHKYAF